MSVTRRRPTVGRPSPRRPGTSQRERLLFGLALLVALPALVWAAVRLTGRDGDRPTFASPTSTGWA